MAGNDGDLCLALKGTQYINVVSEKPKLKLCYVKPIIMSIKRLLLYTGEMAVNVCAFISGIFSKGRKIPTVSLGRSAEFPDLCGNFGFSNSN